MSKSEDEARKFLLKESEADNQLRDWAGTNAEVLLIYLWGWTPRGGPFVPQFTLASGAKFLHCDEEKIALRDVKSDAIYTVWYQAFTREMQRQQKSTILTMKSRSAEVDLMDGPPDPLPFLMARETGRVH